MDCDFGHVARALERVVRHHGGAVDKVGQLYLTHLFRVASNPAYAGDPDFVVVGLLHDVVEDTDCTLEALAEEFPASVVAAVDAMTRREGEPVADYLGRVRANPLALRVKFSDMADNQHPERVARLSTGDAARLGEKYGKYRAILAGLEGAQAAAQQQQQ